MSDFTAGLAAYKSACECDSQGLEAEAIPHYRAALAAGLPPEDWRGALLGLGSSLRNVEAYEESIEVLEGAIAEFPDYPALRGFLAFSYRSAGRPDDAFKTLMDLCLTHIALDGYGRALRHYREELDTPRPR